MTEHFTIHETNKMDFNTLNTAIGRGTTLAHVHLADVDVTRSYRRKTQPLPFEVVPKPVVLTTGRIYRNTTESGLTYIGQTIKPIEERFAEHLAKPANARMAEHLNAKATIELLEEFRFVYARHLRDAETEWIAREIAAKGDVLNHQKAKVQVAHVATAPVALKSVRSLRPRDDDVKKRFEVVIKRKNVAVADQVRRFSYARCLREEALAAAESWCKELSQKYF